MRRRRRAQGEIGRYGGATWHKKRTAASRCANFTNGNHGGNQPKRVSKRHVDPRSRTPSAPQTHPTTVMSFAISSSINAAALSARRAASGSDNVRARAFVRAQPKKSVKAFSICADDAFATRVRAAMAAVGGPPPTPKAEIPQMKKAGAPLPLLPPPRRLRPRHLPRLPRLPPPPTTSPGIPPPAAPPRPPRRASRPSTSITSIPTSPPRRPPTPATPPPRPPRPRT